LLFGYIFTKRYEIKTIYFYPNNGFIKLTWVIDQLDC